MLFVGMLSGTYSSICIATPVLADLKEREPQYKALAKRVQSACLRRARGPARRGQGEPPPRRGRPAGRGARSPAARQDPDLAVAGPGDDESRDGLADEAAVEERGHRCRRAR